ncbi:hypothetical protein ACS0TY_018202 [Phlomoides rotata]
MKHTVDLYNHSRRTTKVTTRVAGMTRYRTYKVSLSERECDCGQWKIDGIPCSHALEVCREYAIDPIIYVHECYSTTEYALTYSLGVVDEMLHPGYIMRWIGPKLVLDNNTKLKMGLDLRLKDRHHIINFVLVH